MPSSSTPQTSGTPAERFRAIIEKAIASGADLSQQVLQLTFSDSARLRRDRLVPDNEISFANGEMAFIGVRVVEGSPVSALVDATIIASDASQPEPLAMAKGQKKSNKEVRKPKAEKAKPAPAGRDFTSPPGKTR